MALDPGAMSRDGYIIDQRRTASVPFGIRTSDKNGCGWIAIYNLMNAMGGSPNPEEVAKELERHLLFGGWLGAHILSLAAYLRKQHIPMELALRPFHAQRLSETCRAGLILYRAGKTNHYVSFVQQGGGKLRFFGAVAGEENHVGTLAEFYDQFVKIPLTLVIMIP